MSDELVKRYDVYPAYHGVDVEECHVGEFVYYADHAARIEQLVATNKQLTAEREASEQDNYRWKMECENFWRDREKTLTEERDKYEGAWMTAEGKLADTEAERDRLREALTELLEVSRRAVRLSVEHDNFKLYAMEPMERAILLSRYALKGETP